jgi:hypothetical protein
MHSNFRLVVAGVVSVLCLGVVPAQSLRAQSAAGHTHSVDAGLIAPRMVGCCR